MMRPVPGFPNYEMDRAGQLWSIKRKVFVKTIAGGIKKYPRYWLYNKGKRYRKWCHRLCCAIWVGPIEGKFVHHKDGDCLNFHSSNLVPLTKEEHLAADRRMRKAREKKKAEELKEGCPF